MPAIAQEPNRADVVLATLAMLTRNTPAANVQPSALSALETALGAVYRANVLDDVLTSDFRSALCHQTVPHVIAYLHANHLITETLDLTSLGHERVTRHASIRTGVNAALSNTSS